MNRMPYSQLASLYQMANSVNSELTGVCHALEANRSAIAMGAEFTLDEGDAVFAALQSAASTLAGAREALLAAPRAAQASDPLLQSLKGVAA